MCIRDSIIRAERVVRQSDGSIEEVVCTCDPLSKSGDVNASRKIKGTLHWVDARTSLPCLLYTSRCV